MKGTSLNTIKQVQISKLMFCIESALNISWPSFNKGTQYVFRESGMGNWNFCEQDLGICNTRIREWKGDFGNP